MNIALPAFILLLFVVPGYLFLSAFERKENTRFEAKPFDVFSAQALVAALILHCVAVALLFYFVTSKISLDLLLKLLLTYKLSKSDLAILHNKILYILTYFGALSLAAFFFGKIAQKMRFWLNPYKDSRFSYNTPWYYELKGKLSTAESAEFTKISCMLQSGGSTYLYYGILEDFYLTQNGELDRLVMSEVVRRPLHDDETPENSGADRFYSIKGDRLIIKYSEIQSLNIEYLYVNQLVS